MAAHAVDPDWDARCFGDEALDAQAANGRIQPDDGRQLITLDINRLPGLVADLLNLGPRRTAAQRPTLRATVTEFAETFTQPADSEDGFILAGARPVPDQFPGARSVTRADLHPGLGAGAGAAAATPGGGP